MKNIWLIAMISIALGITSCSKDDDKESTVYTVTFDTDGGSPVPAAQKIESGSTATAPATNPTKTGYAFMYWYLDGTNAAYNFQAPVNNNITLFAKWQEETTAQYWQVTWNLNGGAWPSGDNHATQVLKGGTLAEPAEPVKADSAFDGWYKEDGLTDKISFPYDVSSITGNFTLYAKWRTGGGQAGDVSLNKNRLEMYTTDRERLTATSTATVTWSTSDKNVAMVSDDGIVKATGAGTAVITASAGSKSAKCDVSVQPSVFLAGYSRYEELYLFKNGKRWIPNNNAYRYFTAKSVCIYEGDVYLSGFVYSSGYNKAGLLKLTSPLSGEQPNIHDERRYDMATTGRQSFGSDVFVANGDIYVCGEEQFIQENTTNVYYYRPTIWKNSVKQHLTTNTSGERYAANAIYVSGSDVYVAGQMDEKAALWKNGVYQELVCEGSAKVGYSAQSNATSVFVSGNDVYVAGVANFPPSGTLNGIPDRKPVIWKNGVAQVLSDDYGYLNSVYVSGSDVFAVGFNGQYWKNGVLQVIDKEPALESVFVYDGDVYIAGYESTSFTRLWKNSDPQELEGQPGHIYSVTVK